jgi:HlyD family secretion protein
VLRALSPNLCPPAGSGFGRLAPSHRRPGGEAGEIKIWAPVIGSEVPVNANDKVHAGEPLLRIDDEEARARIAMAQAQVTMRKRARNDQAAGKAADRRKAEDAVADAEATVVEARDAFDKAALAKRAGGGSGADIATARAAWKSAQDGLDQQRAQLRKLETESKTTFTDRAKANSTSHVPSLGSQLWNLKG